MLHKDKVIVLNQIKFEESDLIIRTLNQQGGLISFIAKGALKSRRRFSGGVLEPGHFIGVEYRLSRRSSLHHLNQAWFLKSFEQLRKSYDHLKTAVYFLSVIDKVAQEGLDSPELFHLLGNSLLAANNSHNLPALLFIFEFRLLWIQGVLPKEFHKEKELLNTTVGEHDKLSNIAIPAPWQKMASNIHLAVTQYAPT